MAGLRAALQDAGCSDVTTVLQSGNIALTSSLSTAKLTGLVEKTLEVEFGVKVPCVVRTGEQIMAVYEKDPLADVASDPARY